MNVGTWLEVLALTLAVGLNSAGTLYAADTDVPLVGELGDPERLVFDGLKTFTAEQIKAQLACDFDYLLAAFPQAPLAELPRVIEERVRLGYRSRGFPDARVETVLAPDVRRVVGVRPGPNNSVEGVLEPDRRRILVRVTEGSRYRCGEVNVSGAKRLTPTDFRTDYEPLIQSDCVLGRMLRGIADAVRQLEPDEGRALVGLLPESYRKPTDQAVALLCADRDQPVQEVLPQVLDQLWKTLLRSRIQAVLRRFGGLPDLKKIPQARRDEDPDLSVDVAKRTRL